MPPRRHPARPPRAPALEVPPAALQTTEALAVAQALEVEEEIWQGGYWLLQRTWDCRIEEVEIWPSAANLAAEVTCSTDTALPLQRSPPRRKVSQYDFHETFEG